MPKPPAPLDQLRDLELLLSAHHPVLYLQTIEEERAVALMEHVADHLDLLYLSWAPGVGLTHPFTDPFHGTVEPSGCLDHILASTGQALFHLRAFAPLLEQAALREKLKDVHKKLWQTQGAVVFTGAGSAELPDDIGRLVTVVELKPPTDREYHQFVADVLRDVRRRQPVRVQIESVDVGRLIQQLRGLTFFEVKKVITAAIAESGALDRMALAKVVQAKKEVIQRSGVLEYTPTDSTLADVAGLDRLKDWLRRRKAAFADPARAEAFGLSAPRGILLLGVPGCGKSLAAKAVASEWELPLIRLDPAHLYTKYVGETEKNLRRAMSTAEAMAPIVLWIDEIEKAFGGGGGDGDAGVARRIFGTFLSWMQERKGEVFVIATSNDVSELPPELLRKGRFDEIFFVDLPGEATRQNILALHVGRRKRDPTQFDLQALAAQSDGFSGAELEQAVVSALYAAYAQGAELETDHIATEIATTRPLSETMAEKIAHLREWASQRAVPAD